MILNSMSVNPEMGLDIHKMALKYRSGKDQINDRISGKNGTPFAILELAYRNSTGVHFHAL